MPTSALPAMADLVTRPADDYRYLGLCSRPHEPNSSLQSPASSTNRGLCMPVSLNFVAAPMVKSGNFGHRVKSDIHLQTV